MANKLGPDYIAKTKEKYSVRYKTPAPITDIDKGMPRKIVGKVLVLGLLIYFAVFLYIALG